MTLNLNFVNTAEKCLLSFQQNNWVLNNNKNEKNNSSNN